MVKRIVPRMVLTAVTGFWRLQPLQYVKCSRDQPFHGITGAVMLNTEFDWALIGLFSVDDSTLIAQTTSSRQNSVFNAMVERPQH
jgi:hypothetical protein